MERRSGTCKGIIAAARRDEHDREWMMRKIFLMIAISLGLSIGCAGAASAQTPEGYTGGQYGYAVKKPVIAGACHFCPWGAAADFVIAAMKPYGWDVQGCFNCSMANSIRLPAGHKI